MKRFRLIPTPKEMSLGDGIASNDVEFIKDSGLGEEEFKIDAKKDSVKVVSGGLRGTLYAEALIKQLKDQNEGRLPVVTIHDCPDIKHRAYYLDQTRGRVMHMSELKRFVDKLAFYRYNELQIYIEHTYAFKCVPELWEDESCFTAEDIRELDAYCASKGIELIPSLSCFGHLYKLLRTEKYRRFCELGEDRSDFSFFDRMGHHTIAVSEAGAVELIEEMLAEYMPLFASKKVNICCDETFDLCEGKSRFLLETKTKKEVYTEYVKTLCDFVKESGRTPMIWGDVIAGDTELIKLLPEDTVCLSWGYGTNEKDTYIKALAENGIEQYVCPGVSGWNHFVNRIGDSFVNIALMCGFGHKHGVSGIMVTDWGDYGHINHPFLSIPGMIFGAAMAWNKEEIKRDLKSMSEDISLVEYGDETLTAVSIQDGISGCEVFDWGTFVRLIDTYAKCATAGDFAEYERRLSELSGELEGKDPAEKEKDLNELRKKIVNNPEILGEELTEILDNAAEGIWIVNRVMTSLCRNEEKEGLNARIEDWFNRYKTNFLRNSKPSDIEKVHDVLRRAEDMLGN